MSSTAVTEIGKNKFFIATHPVLEKEKCDEQVTMSEK